jgi:hypothetical protein
VCLASPTNFHDIEGVFNWCNYAKAVHPCRPYRPTTIVTYSPQDNNGRTTILPPEKNTTYVHPRSAHVLVFRREGIFQGVSDLHDPCNATTLSRRALCTNSPVKNPQQLRPFATLMGLSPGKTTGFEVLVDASLSVFASTSQRAATDCGMYPTIRDPSEWWSATDLLSVC